MNTLSRRFEPTRDVASLHDEVERMFRQALGSGTATAGAFSPALDVEETEDHFTLHVELPGVTADDVEVSLEENVLTIAGERRFYPSSRSDASDGGADRMDGFRRVERHFGRFHRAVRLPDRVDGEHVTANYRDGLLTVTVPKAEEAKPRRITVQAS